MDGIKPITLDDLRTMDIDNYMPSTATTPTRQKRFQIKPDIQPFVFNNVPESGTFEYDLWQQTASMPNAEEERAKIDVAMAFSNALDVDFSTAYDNMDALIQVLASDGKGAGREMIKMKATEARKYIGDMWEAGKIVTDRGRIGFDMVQNGVSPEKLQQAIELDKQMGKYQENETKNPFLYAVGQAANMLPNMIEGMKRGVRRAPATAAAFAGAVATTGAPLVAGPQALATAAPVAASIGGAAAVGLAFGMAWGTAEETFQIEAGNNFLDMVTEGVDPNIAQWGSLGAGFLSALVETVQVGQVLSTIPGADKIFKSGIGEAVQKATNKVAQSAAGRTAIKYGLNVASETGEEVIQEIVSIASEDIVKQLNNKYHGTEYESAWNGAAERILETAIASAAGLAVMGIPGLAGDVMGYRSPATEAQKAIIQQRETAEWARTIERTEGTDAAIKFLNERGINNTETVKVILDGRLPSKDKAYQAVEGELTTQEKEKVSAGMGFNVYEEIQTKEVELAGLKETHKSDPVTYASETIRLSREIDQLRDDKFQIEIETAKRPWMFTAKEWEAQVDERIEKRGEIVFSDEFKQKVAQAIPQASEQEVEAAAIVVDLFSEHIGLTREQFLAAAFKPEIFANIDESAVVLNQGERGAVQFFEDGKALIHASKQSDFSTAIHEMGHVFRKWLPETELEVFEKWAGIEDGKWNRQAEERFAEHLEYFLKEGHAPTPELKNIFSQIADMIRKFFAYIGKRWELTPEVTEGYKKMFAPMERTEQPAGPGFSMEAIARQEQKISDLQTDIDRQEAELRESVLFQDAMQQEAEKRFAKDGEEGYTESKKVIHGTDKEIEKTYNEVKSELEGYAENKNAIYTYSQREFDFTNRRRNTDVQSKIEGTWETHRRIDFTGQTVSGPKEVAQLFAAYRHPRLEHFHLIYLNDNNEIVAHNAMSAGLPSRTFAMEAKNRAKSIYRVNDRIKRLGATKLYVLHNHPSGNVVSSSADQFITAAYGFGVPEFEAHIIIDHDKYNTLKSGRTITDNISDYTGGNEFNKELKKAPIIAGGSDVAKIGFPLLLGRSKEILLALSTKNKVAAVIPIYTEYNIQDIRQKILDAGAYQAIYVTSDKAKKQKKDSLFLANKGTKNDFIIDSVYVEGKDKYESAAAEGVFDSIASAESFSAQNRKQRFLFQEAPPTDSPEFKAWFGDSKVVDKNGEPLVVYTGRTLPIKGYILPEALRGRSVGYAYFTDTPEVAGSYAVTSTPEINQEKTSEASSIKGYAPNVTPVYLSIKNPITEELSVFDIIDKDELTEALIEFNSNLQYDDSNKEINKTLDNFIPEYTAKSLPENLSRLFGLIEDEPSFAEYLKEYDGVVYNDKESGGKTYVPFSPEQIKSVYNKGTFDPDNPNILYQTDFLYQEGLSPKDVQGYVYSRKQIPENIFLHGRRDDSIDLNTGYVIQATQDPNVAESYGRRGSVWALKLPENTPDADEIAETVYNDFHNDSENIDAEIDYYLEYSMDEFIESFNITDILDAAQMWDNEYFVGWFKEKYPEIDAVRFKEGHYGDYAAVFLNIENIERTGIKEDGDVIGQFDKNILYQDTAHKEQARQAVETGLYVPDKVLTEYATEEWAQTELKNRALFSDEATSFQSAEEYVQYAMAMDPEEKPRSYWESIYNSANWRAENDIITRHAGNERFVKSLSKPALVTYLREMARQGGFEGYHGIIQSGAKAAISKGNISDAHYKKIMDQIKADVARYREDFAILVEDQDELQQLQRERESDPAAAEIEDLQKRYQDVRDELKRTKEKLGSYQDRIYNLDARLDWANRDLKKKQTELDETIAETKDAQKDATKSAAQEARLQKEQAVTEAKEHIREVQRQRKEAKEMTEYFHKLVRQIMKPVSAAIKWDHAKQIREIQAGLGLKGPRSKEYQARLELKSLILQNPDADWKPEVRNEASKTSVYDLTIEELEELFDRVDNLRERGRFERDMDILDEDKWIEQQKYGLLQVFGGFPPTDKNIGSKQDKENRKTSVPKKIKFQFIRPDRMVEVLGGGAFKTLLRDYINDSYDIELVEMNRRVEIAQDKMKSLNIKPKDLGRMLQYQGAEYTVDEVIHMWIALQDEDTANTLVNGNLIDPDIIHGLINKLEKKHTDWGQFMMDEFSGDNFERINQVLRESYNKEMVKVEKYFPIRRQNDIIDSYREEMAQEILDRHALRKAYPGKKFTIERTHSEGASEISMRLGATNIFFDQLSKQEKFIATAKLAKRLHRIFGDQDVKRGIRQKLGDEANSWIEKYINDWVNPNIYKINDTLHHTSRVLRNHAALSYLAFNLMTPLKQVPSLAFYLADAGPIQLMRATVESLTNHKEMTAFIDAADPQVKYRSFDRIVEELKLQGKGAYERFVQKVGKVGMAAIQFMDRQAVLIGWKAVYNKGIADGLTHEQAVRKAQDATLRTQPQAAAKDLPQAYRSNEIANWFLMFSNQLNQIYNMVTHDVPQQLKDRKWGKAIGTMSAITISALMIGTLSRRRIPDEPEEIAQDIADQLIAAIPLVGGNIKSGMAGFWGTGVDPVPVAKEVGSLIKEISETIKGNAELELKTMLRVIEAAAVTAGLPTVQPRRIIKTIIEENPWELIGGDWGEED